MEVFADFIEIESIRGYNDVTEEIKEMVSLQYPVNL